MARQNFVHVLLAAASKDAVASGKMLVAVLRQKKPSAWPLGATHSIPRRRMSERNVSFSNYCFARCVSKASSGTKVRLPQGCASSL